MSIHSPLIYNLMILIRAVSVFIMHLPRRIYYGSSYPKLYKKIKVNPNEIDLIIAPRLQSIYSSYGTRIIGGDWDTEYSDSNLILDTNVRTFGNHKPHIYRLKNYVLYTSAKEHYHEGKPWEKTQLYSLATKGKISSLSGNTYNINSEFENIEDVYKSIEKKGYLCQKNIGNSVKKTILPESYYTHSEILVNIGRRGNIIFDDGRHRLISAKLIGLDEIPVRVLVRHKEWQKVRKQFYLADTVEDLDDDLRHFVGHPDLEELL